jgi:hypothetical protein
MRVGDIFEDAHADFHANRLATTIASTFVSWLAQHNESTPLGDLLHRYRYRDDIILYATGPEIGLPNCPDLFIGFAWNPKKAANGEPYGATKGYHSPAKNTTTGEMVYFVVVTEDRDPSNETDVAFGVSSEFLVHELTHYLDRKRQSPTAKYAGPNASSDPAGYVNSPFEFNAFFQQGMHNILKDLNRRSTKDELATFESFQKNNLWHFDHGFRANLSPANQRRFTKRLYRLWMLIKANYPNMHLIAKQADAITD